MTIHASIPIPTNPEPGTPPPTAPEDDPKRGPEVPWHEPGPPVRKINLPPDSPSPGVEIPPAR